MPGCTHDHCSSHNESTSPRYRRVLWVALWINLAMFVIEVGSGLKANSASLLADALDFFGDASNYGVSLFVLNMSLSARAKASLIKGASMLIFGVFVMVLALHNATVQQVPEHFTMGVVGILALIANVAVALMLYRYREGDSNMRSVWLCSRNDAIGNVAVVIAAVLVAATGTMWPDLVVAFLMAGLAVTSSKSVISQALRELKTGQTKAVHGHD